jgi:hypothetical protein
MGDAACASFKLRSYNYTREPLFLSCGSHGRFFRTFEAKDAYLVILSMGNERVDTSTATGKLILNLMLAIVSLTAPLETIPIHLALPVCSAKGATGAGSGVGLGVWGCRKPLTQSGM